LTGHKVRLAKKAGTGAAHTCLSDFNFTPLIVWVKERLKKSKAEFLSDHQGNNG
jgi:hypothetical protein